MQGAVNDPTKPETNLSYTTEAALRSAFKATLATMRLPLGAAGVASRLRPFLTDKYYSNYGVWAFGARAFADYMLPAVAQGWDGAFSEAELVLVEEEQ